MPGDPEFWLDNGLDWFAHITPDAVDNALIGFPLDTAKSSRWMAGHVRRVYFSTVADGVEEYPGKAKIRQELGFIATALDAAIRRFEERSGWAESVLRRYGGLRWEGEIETPFDDGSVDNFSGDLSDEEKIDSLFLREVTKPGGWAEDSLKLARVFPGWQDFRESVKGLYAMRAFLGDATDQLVSQIDPPQWRNQERRKYRIAFASWLSAVYEVAYKKPATINSWQDDCGRSKLGAWPDFFTRIGSLALKLDRIPDLEDMLKAARREYKAQRRGIFEREFPGETPP